jgi:hypothetical protein
LNDASIAVLTLHDKQFEAFERHLFQAMHQRVERAIAATFPALSNPPRSSGDNKDGAEGGQQLKAVVARGIEIAVGFDIGDGPDIAAFIALGLALRIAPPGESRSWILDCLNREGTPGPTKLRMIEWQLRSRAAEDKALGVVAQRVAEARERAKS